MRDRLTSRLARKHRLLRVLLVLAVVLSNTLTILSPDATAQAAAQALDDETFARQQLAGKAVRTGDTIDATELQLADVKKSLSGTHVRFQQRVNGLRVVNAQVAVHYNANRQNVQVTGNFHQSARQMTAAGAALDEAAAITAARNAVGVKGALRGPIIAERVIYPLPGSFVSAWEVRIPASDPLGDWLVFVDAASGKVLDKSNRLRQNTAPPAPRTQSFKLPPPMSRSASPGGQPEGTNVHQAASATATAEGQGKEVTPSPPRNGAKQVPGGAVSVPAEKTVRGIVDGNASGQGEVVETTTRALPAPMAGPAAQAVLPAVGLLSEGFEGVFPSGSWSTFDNDGATNGEFFWDDEPEQPRTGSWSGWPAGGGANGVDPRSFYYANNMHSWMVYGPVNLTGATAGSLDFSLWAQTEQNLDWVTWAVSIDGQQFYGNRMSGSTTTSEPPTTNGHTQRSLDLSNVFTLGSVLGRSQVWVAFIFDTDGSVVDDGPFIDDIRLLMSTGGSCTPNTTAAATATDDKRNPPQTAAAHGPKSAPPGQTTQLPGKPPAAGDGSGSTVQETERKPAHPPKSPSAQTATASDRSAVVQSQTFEGDFPAPGWSVWDDNGPANGDYTWDDVSFHRHNGSWSAWTANGGVDALDPSLCLYPNNQDAWMTYGPVDLSTASAGSLSFWLWAQTEQNWDWVYWMVSIDGQNYYGYRFSGATTSTEPPTASGWTQQSINLAAVPTLGNVLGQQQVWIAFLFESDISNVNDGAFIDDIALDVTDGSNPSCTSGPSSGSGLSFRPNPIASSGVTSLVDGDDADSAALNDKRVSVPLQGLDGSGKLRGAYADLTATGISGGYRSAGQACSTDGAYNYPRSDDRFEEVVVYYHVDATQRYIQSLGFTNVNNRRTPAHAHYGFSYEGGPNAYYSPQNGGLHFFDIYVDIAEDGEVVVHEYGHAVLDNVIPTLWSNESSALHEAFGDYLSGTVLDQYNVSAQKLCLAEWFATDFSESCLRRLDSTKHYPEDIEGEGHADGEIWSATLWQIRSALGATTADKVILEGLFYTDDRGMFVDAANGILQADQALNGGANQNTIRSIFVNRGILAPTQNYSLTVATSGSGTVTGTGINCGSDCTENYTSGTSVTLTAAPASGWSFTGWSGACTGTGNCVLTMSQARSVTATFTQNAFLLTVSTSGSGTVTGTGINCGADCTESYTSGTSVTLTAAPSSGWSFTGWSGACSGTGNCALTMSQARSVTATFTQNAYLLTVFTSGSGTITGSGINCGIDCSDTYLNNTQVTLTATPIGNASFTGWSGDCTGMGSCVVTMNQARSVSASFTLATYLLTVTRNGTGQVTSAGIDCGSDCTESYTSGTTVTLTATPLNGWTFTGWTGACSGWSTVCQVPINAAKAVTATFLNVDVGIDVNRPTGLPPSGGPTLVVTLTARPGCGTIDHIQFGDIGVPFDNARVTVIFPGSGPPTQTSGFTYTPAPGTTTSVTINLQRVVQSGGATVDHIQFYDRCGLWKTMVGGGSRAFSTP